LSQPGFPALPQSTLGYDSPVMALNHETSMGSGHNDFTFSSAMDWAAIKSKSEWSVLILSGLIKWYFNGAFAIFASF
jgi:hypothetical protein